MSSNFSSTLTTYNQHAAQFVQHFERKLDTKELDKFLSLIPKGGHILDAGCGSARDTAYFIGNGYKALGIDLSEGLLAEAKKIHPEVQTQFMSLTDIALPKESFDGIWCKAALLHVERNEIPKVLKSFNQILKKNGHLFIQTKSGEGEGEQPVPFDPTMTRYFTFFSLDELTGLLEQTGFEVTDSYDFNGKQRNIVSRDQEWIVLFSKKMG